MGRVGDTQVATMVWVVGVLGGVVGPQVSVLLLCFITHISFIYILCMHQIFILKMNNQFMP